MVVTKEADMPDGRAGGETFLRAGTDTGTKSRTAIGVPYEGLELRANGAFWASRSLDLEERDTMEREPW